MLLNLMYCSDNSQYTQIRSRQKTKCNKTIKNSETEYVWGGKTSIRIYLCSIVDELIFGSKTEKMKIQNPHFKNLKCTKCICNRI